MVKVYGIFLLFLFHLHSSRTRVYEEARRVDSTNVSFPLLIGVFPDDEEIRSKAPPSAEELARRAGYGLESHRTTTKDGYNLIIHRLLRTNEKEEDEDGVVRKSSENSTRPVVLLQHGIAQSSSDWLINDSGKSFAMFLVDSGYDVWLGNSRGNKYSNSHLSLDEETMEFYNFTFHEQGMYDFPATIDLILKETGRRKISYVGCSVGATVFFVGISINPEYAERINFMGAISPLTFLTHTKTPIKILSPHLNEIKEVAVKLAMMRLNPETLPAMINSQLGKLCFWRAFSRGLCNSIYKMLDEFGLRRIEEEHLEALWKYIPTTTSAKIFMHLLQLMKYPEEIFDAYDLGFEGNSKIYGSPSPPEYDLSLIRLPVAIFTGSDELFSTAEDTNALMKSLPYMVRHVVASSKFKVHTDFTHEASAIEEIFKPMKFILDFYNKHDQN